MGLIHLFAALSLLFLAVSYGLPTAQELELGEGLRKDAEALRAFRRGIENDPSGALRDWGAIANPCQWHGVECARVPSGSLSENSLGELEDRVVRIELWGLELEGFISDAIGDLSELRTLAIVGNKLTGHIPVEVSNCQNLVTLDLRANELFGAIGFSLANLPRLEVLKLSENRLTGTLGVLLDERKSSLNFDPFHFLGGRTKTKESLTGLCSHLQVLDLAKNSLYGKISTAIGSCTQLSEVTLNDNRFAGEIPATLSALPHLRSLLLNHNVLDGTLPSAIALGCKKLLFLNVADNLLSGSIPFEFATFGGARHFNFSNNLLEGSIPLGKWKVREMAMEGIFSSNPGLCGWPLSQVCETPEQRLPRNLPRVSASNLLYRSTSFIVKLYTSLQAVGRHILSVRERGRIGLAQALRVRRRSMAEIASPTASPTVSPTPHQYKHTARRWALGLALGLVAGAIAAVLLATILRLCIFYMQKAPFLQGPIIFHPNISPKMLLFLEKDEALSEADVVGQGGAGRVYRTQLENEMVVAVKTVAAKDDQKGQFGQKQIQSELETLGCIRHRNLVVLLAYVHRPDYHLLLYEYMQNGSLHHVLRKIESRELEVPWPIRHKIAVGTCQGLSYLHFLSNPTIVHRDLKPSNILLDANFEAHVSDFGLAKVIPGFDTHVTTGVAGTVGYIAPEYSQTCRFSDKCDVYSFGVVLAVLLTGKDPTDEFFQTWGSIGNWLHDLMQNGDGREAIDPTLRTADGAFDPNILLALKIAVFCTNAYPNERPSSKEVLIMLRQIPVEEKP